MPYLHRYDNCFNPTLKGATYNLATIQFRRCLSAESDDNPTNDYIRELANPEGKLTSMSIDMFTRKINKRSEDKK